MSGSTNIPRWIAAAGLAGMAGAAAERIGLRALPLEAAADIIVLAGAIGAAVGLVLGSLAALLRR